MVKQDPDGFPLMGAHVFMFAQVHVGFDDHGCLLGKGFGHLQCSTEGGEIQQGLNAQQS